MDHAGIEVDRQIVEWVNNNLEHLEYVLNGINFQWTGRGRHVSMDDIGFRANQLKRSFKTLPISTSFKSKIKEHTVKLTPIKEVIENSWPFLQGDTAK